MRIRIGDIVLCRGDAAGLGDGEVVAKRGADFLVSWPHRGLDGLGFKARELIKIAGRYDNGPAPEPLPAGHLRCEFVSDDCVGTCREPAVWRMRATCAFAAIRLWPDYNGKPQVCQAHTERLIATGDKTNVGRWSIDSDARVRP